MSVRVYINDAQFRAETIGLTPMDKGWGVALLLHTIRCLHILAEPMLKATESFVFYCQVNADAPVGDFVEFMILSIDKLMALDPETGETDVKTVTKLLQEQAGLARQYPAFMALAIHIIRIHGKDQFLQKMIEPLCLCPGTGDKRKIGTKTCGGCRMIKYCSAECAKADWPAHKVNCTKK